MSPPSTQHADTQGMAEVRRPWLPGSLHRRGFTQRTVVRLSYIVVEELLIDAQDSVATLTIAPWPAADGLGRVRFDLDDVVEVTLLAEDLDQQLYEGWLPHGPQIGDVFASAVAGEVLREAHDQLWRQPLARLLPEAVYDIAEDARTVARLALYAARSDVRAAEWVSRNDLGDTVVAPERAAPQRTLSAPPERVR